MKTLYSFFIKNVGNFNFFSQIFILLLLILLIRKEMQIIIIRKLK